MNSDTSSPYDDDEAYMRFHGKPRPDAQGREAYLLMAGLEKAKSVRRLQIDLAEDGRYLLEPYHAIGRIECSMDGKHLTIYLHSGHIVLCSGVHLERLLEPLCKEQLSRLFCYDEALHYLPSADNPVIIRMIEGNPQEIMEKAT
jgi:hypothetical protein